jgi:ribonuclease BN (tRNA processing enzyme)
MFHNTKIRVHLALVTFELVSKNQFLVSVLFKVLGCGDAFASEGRFNTSFMLEAEEERVLIDCGASTLIRLKHERVDVMSISTIIITHFHGDHYGGLPFFALARYVEAKSREPYTIIGPAGIAEKVFQLQEALYPGTSNILKEMKVNFVEFHDSEWVEHDDLSVYARQVKHSPPSNPHGVKIRIHESIFAFSGDTEWTEALIDLANEADLFICECNHYEGEGPAHLSYETLKKHMHQLKAKRIYLTHMNSEVINAHEFEIVRLADGMEFDF